LKTIRSHAERISRVTRSILTFSRGTVSVLKPVDMNGVARSCLAMAGERTSALAVRLESRLATSLPPILGDRARLETVLLNLINNGIDAVTARSGGGRVTVETSVMEMEGQPWVEIRVRDNGPGIPGANIDRVFDPFFSTKPAGQGTGLGLFLTYGIVADHRGRIEVKNGQTGAVFTVVLPTVGRSMTTARGASWESQAKS
jgi:C4-dicarboxylate-specific signal transduction histidine kinase